MSIHQLDVRRLEPPEPTVRILSKLSELGAEDDLEVTHFREPFPLYPRSNKRALSTPSKNWARTCTFGT